MTFKSCYNLEKAANIIKILDWVEYAFIVLGDCLETPQLPNVDCYLEKQSSFANDLLILRGDGCFANKFRTGWYFVKSKVFKATIRIRNIILVRVTLCTMKHTWYTLTLMDGVEILCLENWVSLLALLCILTHTSSVKD